MSFSESADEKQWKSAAAGLPRGARSLVL